jgi:hypothetical protein
MKTLFLTQKKSYLDVVYENYMRDFVFDIDPADGKLSFYIKWYMEEDGTKVWWNLDQIEEVVHTLDIGHEGIHNNPLFKYGLTEDELFKLRRRIISFVSSMNQEEYDYEERIKRESTKRLT